MRRPLCLLCLIFVLLVMGFMTVFADAYLDPGQGRLQPETDSQKQKISLPENESNHKLYGYIYAMEEKNGRSVLYIKSTEENRSVICYLSEEVSSLQSLKIGYQVIIKGKVCRFEAASNDGQFDAR